MTKKKVAAKSVAEPAPKSTLLNSAFEALEDYVRKQVSDINGILCRIQVNYVKVPELGCFSDAIEVLQTRVKELDEAQTTAENSTQQIADLTTLVNAALGQNKTWFAQINDREHASARRDLFLLKIIAQLTRRLEVLESPVASHLPCPHGHARGFFALRSPSPCIADAGHGGPHATSCALPGYREWETSSAWDRIRTADGGWIRA